jgi:hypothetical protein
MIHWFLNLFRRDMPPARYTSEHLYHFVGFANPDDDSANYGTLFKIIRSGKVIYKGFDARTIGMDYSIDWSVDVAKGKLILPAVTCYGDIPREALKIHMTKYGKVGIGFRRSFLVTKGARPVIYIPVKQKDYWDGFGPNRGKLGLQSLLSAWDAFHEYVSFPAGQRRNEIYAHDRPRDADEAILRMESLMEKDFLPFLKAFDSELLEEHIDNFYMEREWRLIGKLSFFRDDIAEIIIPKKLTNEFIADFPKLANCIKTTEELLR